MFFTGGSWTPQDTEMFGVCIRTHGTPPLCVLYDICIIKIAVKLAVEGRKEKRNLPQEKEWGLLEYPLFSKLFYFTFVF